MNIKITFLTTIMFVIVTTIFPNQADAEVQYQIIDLGKIGNYSYDPIPYSINDLDQITGKISTFGGDRAFLYEDGTMIDLGTLGGSLSIGAGINNSGHIVGFSRYTSRNYDEHAFLYDGNTMVDLGTFPGTVWKSGAYGISNSGLITGYSEIFEFPMFYPLPHAFILDGDSWTNIGTLIWYSPNPDARDLCSISSSSGRDINDNGQVTGVSVSFYRYNCGNDHAFLYDGFTMIDLGTLGSPELRSSGQAINNNGQVTGESETDDGNYHAFITEGTTMVDLGTLGGPRSVGLDINDYGHVTGWALISEHEIDAFLYDGTEMIGLCSLVDCEGQGWSQLRTGTAINNKGSIAGWGYVDGDYEIHAFLIKVLNDNEGPASTNIIVEPSIVAVGGEVMLTATVDDTEFGNSNIASAEYSIDNEIWSPITGGNWDSPTVVVDSLIAAPTTAGVYELCVRGTDVFNNEGLPECEILVVYDPDGSFVTGGGWFDSPEGALSSDPMLSGKANFGFVSKYTKGASIPTGNTEFQFKAGNLNFKSKTYDWLVIAGFRAQFKGVGTINGNGNYRFILTAIDRSSDTFRIMIWTEDEATATESVIYDNGFDQPIGGGSIIIH